MNEYRKWLKTEKMGTARKSFSKVFAKGGIAPFSKRTRENSNFYRSSDWENLWGDIFTLASEVLKEDS